MVLHLRVNKYPLSNLERRFVRKYLTVQIKGRLKSPWHCKVLSSLTVHYWQK